VEFYEGVVPFSTLFALYRYYLAYSLWSATSVMLSLSYFSHFLCLAQTGSRLTKVTCQKIYPSAAGLSN